MVDLATQVNTALQRATDSLVDEIAKDGLMVFKKVLDESGFLRSPYLKNYEVLSHVEDSLITFELIIDISALNQKEDQVREMLEAARPGMISEAARTYGIGAKGVQRLIGPRDIRTPSRDARRPARDARTPAKDARRNASQRLIGHEVALHAPRSMNVTREGKISVLFKRSLRETESGIHFPKGKFQGLLAKFIEDLSDVVLEKFTPAFKSVLVKYAL